MAGDKDREKGSDLIGSGLSDAGKDAGGSGLQSAAPDDEGKHRLSGGSLKRNTYSVTRAAQKRPYRETQDKIDHLPVASTSQEDETEFKRRRSRQDINRTHRRKVRTRSTILTFIIVIVAITIASFVGIAAFAGSVNARLSSGLSDSNLSESLVSPENDTDPYYVLLVGIDGQQSDGESQADAIMLMRVDPSSASISIISIPRDAYVSIGGHGKDTISKAYTYGGPSLLVDSVASFAGVDIAHYAEIGYMGLVAITDQLGGVTVDVPKNTTVNGESVPEGTQTISGTQALIFLRCIQTYADGDFDRIVNQQSFIRALIEPISETSAFTRARIVETFSKYGNTDMDVYQIQNLLAMVKRMNSDDLTFGTVPSHTSTNSTSSTAYVDSDEWNAMMARVEQGLSPVDPEAVAAAEQTMSSINPTDYLITVKNGSGVAGCATQAAERLQAAGWGIESTGNTNSFVYTETLVVYNKGSDTTVANRIVSDLGVGRVVKNDGSYVFDGDYLVVVGGDWTP